MSLVPVFLNTHYLEMFPQSAICIFDSEVSGYQKRPITVSGAISETLKQNFAASMLLNVAASNFHITHTDTSLGSLARFLQIDVYDFV